jgi:hypothetical protein
MRKHPLGVAHDLRLILSNECRLESDYLAEPAQVVKVGRLKTRFCPAFRVLLQQLLQQLSCDYFGLRVKQSAIVEARKEQKGQDVRSHEVRKERGQPRGLLDQRVQRWDLVQAMLQVGCYVIVEGFRELGLAELWVFGFG